MVKYRETIFLITYLIAFNLYAQDNTPDFSSINTEQYPIHIINEKNFDPKQLLNIVPTEFFSDDKSKIEYLKPVRFIIYLSTSETDLSATIFDIFAPNTKSVKAYGILKDPTHHSIDQLIELPVIKNRNFNFSVTTKEKLSSVILYTSIEDYFDFSVKTYSLVRFFEREKGMNIFYGFSFGSFLLLILYHLILFLKVRDRLYLYYILLIIISGLLILPNSGLFNVANLSYYKIICTFYFVVCILISVYFLKIYASYKKIIIGLIALTLIVNILNIFTSNIIIQYAVFIIGFIIYFLILITSVNWFKSIANTAKWFIAPWGFLFLAQLAFLLKFDTFFKYYHWYEVGMLANICFMALAIGNRINIYKSEKNDAETNELQASIERKKIILEQNNILEQLIGERNSEILKKNKKLLDQQIEIENNNELINKANLKLEIINQELLNLNNEIDQQNSELEKHQGFLEIIVEKRTKKLIAAKERAIVADKLKTSFLNNLTYEIRTPMSAITGYANLLNDKALPTDRRNEYLTYINKNVDILLESIDNIVILAKIQARILKPKAIDFNLDDLFNYCYDYFDEKLKSFGKEHITFKIDTSAINQTTLLLADYEKIWQILFKLLDNSIKYTEKGKIEMVCFLETFKNQDSTHNLRIIIKDTGIGIEKDKLQFIFEQFSNIEEDKTKLYHGAGFGLAIVKGFIDILHGKINVKSEPYQGSSFEISIPVVVRPNQFVQN